MSEKKKRLVWEEIEKQYNQEWIELVDYEWEQGTPFPTAGVVRTHASGRKKLYELVKGLEPTQRGSAFLYVGKPARVQGEVFSSFHMAMPG